jgi:hypothetical protein
MSVIKTGNVAHDNALIAAETSRQVAATAAGMNAAQMKTADIAFYRACKASAVANNNNGGVEQFTNALRELGTGGT